MAANCLQPLTRLKSGRAACTRAANQRAADHRGCKLGAIRQHKRKRVAFFEATILKKSGDRKRICIELGVCNTNFTILCVDLQPKFYLKVCFLQSETDDRRSIGRSCRV